MDLDPHQQLERRLFARYEPERHGIPGRLWCRPSSPGDEHSIASLTAARDDIDIEDAKRALLDGWIPPRLGRALFVAGIAATPERVLAFARAARFDPPEGAPANCAPAGIYLAGVVVDPEFRRRGLGRMLTEARIAWGSQLGEVLYYFCNARNLASIDLHREFGFTESTRDFWFPAVRFLGGEGILFRRERPA